MYFVVELGKIFPKSEFISKLIEWGFEPNEYVRAVDTRGRVVCGQYRVLRHGHC